MSIADLKVGDAAVIESLDAPEAAMRRRLMALGLAPGERIVVEQRYPAFVIRVGWTRVALDLETASSIAVSASEADAS